MNILGTTSASLSKDIENAIAAFTKTINKLETTVAKANEEKKAKEEEIKTLQTECSALDAVANQAGNLASKIKTLLS